jgi:hypothetical protein
VRSRNLSAVTTVDKDPHHDGTVKERLARAADTEITVWREHMEVADQPTSYGERPRQCNSPGCCVGTT